MIEQANQDGTPTGNEGGEAETLSAEQIAELKAKAEKADKLEAEIGSLKRDLKNVKKALEPEKETPKENTPQNEPDYARLAYLKAEGVTHPDDQKVVQDEANRLKLPLTDVLQMEHIKNTLRNNADQRVSQEGMPQGSGRKGGPGKGDVDYYIQHPDEVPTDLELHNKVIDAKLAKERNANMFSDVPFVG